MSKNTVVIDKKLLQKFAEFTKVVLSEIRDLKSQLSDQMSKVAEHDELTEAYHNSVTKVANHIYDSDFEFLIDGDRKKFIKRAAQDPDFLAGVFGKVCKASDVSLIGKPARVATSKKIASYDPVYAKAFGYVDQQYMMTDLED